MDSGLWWNSLSTCRPDNASSLSGPKNALFPQHLYCVTCLPHAEYLQCVHCGISAPLNSLMEKKHLMISFLLLFFFWEHSDTLWTCTYWLPVIVSCGYNSTYKYCYKKTQVKLFSHMPVVWVCAKTLTYCSSVAWARAGALSELLSHGFAGPGGTVSEKWPKESIYCVLIPVQLDPM